MLVAAVQPVADRPRFGERQVRTAVRAFHEIAVDLAFGGRGRMCTTIEDLTAAAKEFMARPGPMMVDLRISKSVPSVPYRRIHYGRDE